MGNRAAPKWIRVLDWAVLAGLVAILVIQLTGGFSARLSGIRLSVHSPYRLLAIIALLLVIRSIWSRRASASGDLDEPAWFRRDAVISCMPPLTSREWLCAFGFFTAAVAGVVHQQVAAPLSVPDHGDPLFSTWRMAWVTRALFGEGRLFDANIFHPEPRTLAYSDSMILPSLVAAPLFWVGLPPIAVYNLLLLAAFVTSAVFTYAFVSRLTGSRWAGLVSGTIFGLYPFRFEHYSHLELQMTMWMPLALWVLHGLVQQGRVRTGLVLGMLIGAQALSSVYLGMYLSIHLAVVSVALLVASGVRPLSPRFAALGVAALVTGLSVVPVAVPYLMNRERLGERGAHENLVYSATIGDYTRSHPQSRLYRDRLETGPPERRLFPGMTALALASVALVPPLTTVRAAYAAALFVSFDASLGFNGHLYPTLYSWLLPMRGLRVPARFSVLVGLTLAILAGLAVARLEGRLRGRLSPVVRGGLAGVAMLAVIAEYQPRLELRPVWRDLPPVYRPILARAPSVLAVFPMTSEPSDNDAKYMYFSIWHRHSLVNGYSGNFPPSYYELLASMRRFPLPDAIQYLRERGVEFIVLHGEFLAADQIDRATAVLHADSRLEHVARAPAGLRTSHLYRFRDPLTARTGER